MGRDHLHLLPFNASLKVEFHFGELFPRVGFIMTNLVADQLAATVGEDRRQAGQACPVLMADAGREPSPRRLFRTMVRGIAALPVATV
jgi:hypothetical protein